MNVGKLGSEMAHTPSSVPPVSKKGCLSAYKTME